MFIYPMHFSKWYVVLLVIMLISTFLSFNVQHTFDKWNKKKSYRGLTGAEVAEQILRQNGICDVRINCIAGRLSDHYNPRNRTLNLSSEVANGNSIAALAVAAHECGHAIQHYKGYALLTIRNSMVPIVNLGSSAGIYLCLLGIIFGSSQFGSIIVNIGLCLFGFAVLFQVLTLPVEFNASHRAINILQTNRFISAEETVGARKVLVAAALTYVAATAAAIVNFLRVFAMTKRNE